MATKNLVNVGSYPMINNAQDIEDILCLATLIAVGEFPMKGSWNWSLEDARQFRDKLDPNGCIDCPFCQKCLGSIINEQES